MNRKPWIATLTGAVVVSLALTANAAHAGHAYAVGRAGPAQGVYDYARVISVEPIVRYVTVTTPVRECWEETRYRTVTHQRSSAGGTLIGAVIGGVVGHQFGSGRGNDAATVAGTLIGAAVGNDIARRRTVDEGYYGASQIAEPVQRCATNYRTHEEERIEAYRVVYRYKGQKYATRMPYDPGNRLRVRVDVRPAG